MRAEHEVIELANRAAEKLDEPDEFPGKSWQQTVHEVLSWVLDEEEPHPAD